MSDETPTPDAQSGGTPPEYLQPVLIVIRKTPDGSQTTPDASQTPVGFADTSNTSSTPAADTGNVQQPAGSATDLLSILNQAGVTASGLFTDTGGSTAPVAPDGATPQASTTDANAAQGLNLDNFLSIFASLDKLQSLVDTLLASPDVEAAYIKPAGELPFVGNGNTGPSANAPAGATPDFTARQGYLDPAPGGIDARYAWTCAGGDGAGVQIIDLEGGWQTTHEDLAQNQGGVVIGTSATGADGTDHGTAVLGVFSGDNNGFGVTGICPGANVRMAAALMVTAPTGVQPISSKTIKSAADLLNAGDIMLIEIHLPGPRNNFQFRKDQKGYIAIEWWPDDFAALKYATNKGIIVVEAAGNGAENFDDPIYSTAPKGFPKDWSNPFARGSRDSGAILVGAGSPAPTTHGRDPATNPGFLTTDRARLEFSNYGAAVDVQGWGREVTSTGYGDLQGGTDQNKWYTDIFGGTSSASPIVVGAVGCMQGVRKAANLAVLTPDQVRSIFRTTGSPQQDGANGPATQNIGNRPDLKAIIPLILSTTYNANDGVAPPADGTAVV